MLHNIMITNYPIPTCYTTNTLHFYDQHKYPTLTTLLDMVREKGILSGGRFCLWRMLKEMGFTYKKHDNIYEHRISEQRHEYIKQLGRKTRQSDEIWINVYHTQKHIWIDFDTRGGCKITVMMKLMTMMI